MILAADLRVLGIVIAMYYNDYEPPYFHAVYGEHRASVAIRPVAIMDGTLPRRAASLVFEWAAQDQHELERNWQKAREHQPLDRIAPLD